MPFRLWKLLRRNRGAPQGVLTGQSVPAVAHIYTALADVLRDQIAAQAESANSNNLESVALMAADLAIVLALLLLRATDPQSFGFWWWIPLPLFVVSAAFLMAPVLPPSERRMFQGGPHVPSFIEAISGDPQTLEETLARLLKDLQQTWENNDQLLKRERQSITRGLFALCVASFVAIGLYSWGLS